MSLGRLWLQSRFLCLCLLGLFLYTGCEHRPLEEMLWDENIFIRIYYNENIRNVSFGFYDESKKKPEYSSPQMMQNLYFIWGGVFLCKKKKELSKLQQQL